MKINKKQQNQIGTVSGIGIVVGTYFYNTQTITNFLNTLTTTPIVLSIIGIGVSIYFGKKLIK